MGWATILVVLPIWMLHPLVESTVISSTVDPSHPQWARVAMVNTGILLISSSIAGGQGAMDVSSTGLAHLSGPPSANGSLMVHQTVSLSRWGWAIISLLVLSPVAAYLWHSWRDNEVMHGTEEGMSGS